MGGPSVVILNSYKIELVAVTIWVSRLKRYIFTNWESMMKQERVWGERNISHFYYVHCEMFVSIVKCENSLGNMQRPMKHEMCLKYWLMSFISIKTLDNCFLLDVTYIGTEAHSWNSHECVRHRLFWRLIMSFEREGERNHNHWSVYNQKRHFKLKLHLRLFEVC